MEATQHLVDTIIEGIHEKKGRDVVTVQMEQILTAPAAYFVICTCGSPQQVSAVCDSVEEFARKKAGEKPAHVIGKQNGQWVAMDYGTVMVHIFMEEAREHYSLEDLWSDAVLTHYPDVD